MNTKSLLEALKKLNEQEVIMDLNKYKEILDADFIDFEIE